MQTDIHIAIIDDHSIFLEGLSVLIADIDYVSEVHAFATPAKFFDELRAGAPFNLIICDLIMQSMNGLAFLAAVRNHCRHVPVIVLSGINVNPPLDEIRRLGGNGFVHKSTDQRTLKSVIKAVLDGQTYFGQIEDSRLAPPENHASNATDTAYLAPNISPRQTEILRCIASGDSNRDIAARLDISENTVKTHLKQIFTELGVNKRTACIRKAQALGLI